MSELYKVFGLSAQLHALSVDGSLTLCAVSDPPTLLYLKKQMDEGMGHDLGLLSGHGFNS